MTQLMSYVFQGEDSQSRFIPVTVEVVLWPGLPVLQILGLRDTQGRDSALRIKSALKAQGFDFPQTQQILVNLRSELDRVSSTGLELAIAMAYLLETEQMPKLDPRLSQRIFAFGELSLDGVVEPLKDLPQIPFESSIELLFCSVSGSAPPGAGALISLKTLADLRGPWRTLSRQQPVELKRPTRPESSQSSWSLDEAEILKLLACGQHSSLLAGPADRCAPIHRARRSRRTRTTRSGAARPRNRPTTPTASP